MAKQLPILASFSEEANLFLEKENKHIGPMLRLVRPMLATVAAVMPQFVVQACTGTGPLPFESWLIVALVSFSFLIQRVLAIFLGG